MGGEGMLCGICSSGRLQLVTCVAQDDLLLVAVVCWSHVLF
jgi:hypothetical protein